MSERLRVQVTVDTDELREWADRHADMGNHGVAHVLYQAAADGESLSEQAIREAVAEERERIATAIEALRPDAAMPSPMSYRDARDDAARIARAGTEEP